MNEWMNDDDENDENCYLEEIESCGRRGYSCYHFLVFFIEFGDEERILLWNFSSVGCCSVFVGFSVRSRNVVLKISTCNSTQVR